MSHCVVFLQSSISLVHTHTHTSTCLMLTTSRLWTATLTWPLLLNRSGFGCYLSLNSTMSFWISKKQKSCRVISFKSLCLILQLLPTCANLLNEIFASCDWFRSRLQPSSYSKSPAGMDPFVIDWKKKEKTSSLISTDWSANCQILSASELQGISRLRIPANLANLCAFWSP